MRATSRLQADQRPVEAVSLAVFAADGWTIRPPDLPPLDGGISPGRGLRPDAVRLVAVAAALSKPAPAVNPIVEATRAWADWLTSPLVVAGDFGSSGKGDRRRKPTSQQHAPVLKALESLDLRSAYHAHFGVAQGEEQHATYWRWRHEDKPFHIDHVFVSPALATTDLKAGRGPAGTDSPTMPR